MADEVFIDPGKVLPRLTTKKESTIENRDLTAAGKMLDDRRTGKKRE